LLLKEHLKGIDPGIASIISLIAEKSKQIKAAFLTHNTLAGTKNIYGEEQLELDRWADELLINAFRDSKLVKTVASEEQSEVVEIIKAEGTFGVTLDPLDGVSCVKTNLSVGTIAGIFDEGDVMEKGSKMDAACYVVYGPLTTLIYSAKNGVHEFVIDDKTGQFVLVKEDIKIPDGKIYSPGGLAKDYTPQHRKWIQALEKEGYKLRYSGSFTADVHQALTYGGVFTYPALVNKPEGKLRLLFECNPMSFIVKQAGGASSNGHESILNIKPKKLSQRVPVYVGSKTPIELIEKIMKEGGADK